MEGDAGLVVRGRSSYYMRDALYTLSIGAAFLVLQLLTYALGWTDNLLLVPFGIGAAAAFLIGLALVGIGSWSRRCRSCGVGLHPDRYVVVAEPAFSDVADALDRGDAAGIVAAVTAQPRLPEDKWLQLQVEYCPKCERVAVLSLERPMFVRNWPRTRVCSGEGVQSLLEIAEVHLG